MPLSNGSWKDAFESLTVEQQHWIELRAFEAVARICEKIAGSTPMSSGLALSLDPASLLLRSYDEYVSRALRYQMLQEQVREWSIADLSRTLAWKATKEVQDHLRKTRASLSNPSRHTGSQREPDKEHKDWIETIIAYLGAMDTKTARDAAIFFRYVWEHTDTLTETPRRGISFKAQSIASELTRLENDAWDTNRVQRARSFAIREMSRFPGSSIAEVVRLIQLKKA